MIDDQLAVAISRVLADYDVGGLSDRDAAQQTVLASLDELVRIAPGRSVEVRIPPFGAVQAVAGGAHRRGTPRAVVETDPVTWLRLVIGHITWAEATASGAVHASGERSDLSQYLPFITSD